MAYLEINGVNKSFSRTQREKGRLPVLRDINLAINENQFVCIVGRSGSGKTTLISLIAGLIELDSGEILLEGKPIAGPGPDRGVVFQNYSLLPWLNVYENVYLAVDAVAPQLAEAEKRERVEHYIRLVNLSAAMKKVPRELSGGMRQRVAVARGLAMDPKVLLMDEPFSALDALTRSSLQEELARIWMETQKTVVMITNDIDEAILLSDSIYTLTSGPGATLGTAVRVETPHPRSHVQLIREPSYQRVRRETIALLTAAVKKDAIDSHSGRNKTLFH
jgi:nitrate/nitrite transport system ATP-binding protein